MRVKHLSRRQIDHAVNNQKQIAQAKENRALKELADLDYQDKLKKYANVPRHAVPKTTFESDTTNGLTACVIRWLHLNGHFASRIQSQGQWNQKLGIFTRSNVQKGIADVTTVIRGRSCMIEIKKGKDKLSADQERFKQEYEASGGYYFECRTFQDFLQWYGGFDSHKDHPKR